MSGLPDTRFYLDDGSGTFPIQIPSSLVLLEDGYQFSRGRGDTQSSPTAGTMSLTFKNGEKGYIGAFTPGSTILASPSPIKLDARIRVKEIVNGTTFNRYTGYVKSWAVGWPNGTENTGVVRITCSDAQARAERRVLRSVVEEEIMADSPSFYATFGEPASAVSAGDSSGSQRPPLVQTGGGTAVTFGTDIGPGTDSLTAAHFAGGQYLTSSLTADPNSYEAWFVTSTDGTIFSTSLGRVLSISSGKLKFDSSAGNVSSAASVNDGLLHYAAVQFGGGATVTLYLDGVSVGTCPGAAVGGGGSVAISVGQGFTGSLAHFATDAASGSVRIGAHYTAGTTGFAGESGTARITRLAGYVGLTIGTLGTSLTNVAFVDFTGQSAWQAIQDVADAEMGVAYINSSGTLDFHNRQLVTTKTSPDLTLSSSFVTFDAEPTTDDQDLLNYMEATATATGAVQLARNTISENGDATHPAHGRYSDSKEYLVSTDGEALDRANWLVTTRAQPSSAGRYGTLTVNLYGMSPAQQLLVVQGLESGCWLRVVSMPTQTTGGTTVDVVVEGINPAQSGTGWTIQCNVVSKSALYPKVFILDSSLLDGPDLLAV